jgi:hypothetical protein
VGAAPGAGEAHRPNILTFDAYRAAVCGDGDLFGTPAGKDADPEHRRRAAEDFAALAMPDERTLELLWDTVWWRRVAYFATLISTALLLLFPWIASEATASSNHAIARVADLISSLSWTYADPWVSSFKGHPKAVGLLVAATTLFALWGSLLDRRIHDRALAAWTGQARAKRYRWFRHSLRVRFVVATLLFLSCLLLLLLMLGWLWPLTDVYSFILFIIGGVPLIALEISLSVWWYSLWRIRRQVADEQEQQGEIRGPALWVANKMRTSVLTATPYRLFDRHVLPTLFAIVLVASCLVAASRISFDLIESAGFVCDHASRGEVPNAGMTFTLNTNEICRDAGVELKAGKSYDIEVRDPIGWKDDNGATVAPYQDNPTTLAIGWPKLLQLPLRRRLTSPWFVVVARIGEYGSEEQDLSWSNRVTPKKAGELYLFVNDATIGLPNYDYFYRHNEGSVTVTIKPTPGQP